MSTGKNRLAGKFEEVDVCELTCELECENLENRDTLSQLQIEVLIGERRSFTEQIRMVTGPIVESGAFPLIQIINGEKTTQSVPVKSALRDQSSDSILHVSDPISDTTFLISFDGDTWNPTNISSLIVPRASEIIELIISSQPIVVRAEGHSFYLEEQASIPKNLLN